MNSTENQEENTALVTPSVIRKGLCIFEDKGKNWYHIYIQVIYFW